MNISSMGTTTKLKMQVAILAIPSLALVPTIATDKGWPRTCQQRVTKVAAGEDRQ
jgi:hypothetical protein